MKDIFDVLVLYINIPYLACFIFLSYGLRDIASLLIIKLFPNTNKDRAYGVFVIGILLAFPFYYLGEKDVVKLLVTYCVGTSLYELVISAIIDGLTRLTKEKTAS